VKKLARHAETRGDPDRTSRSRKNLELVSADSLDGRMGPVVLFGHGGVDSELMKDVALAGRRLDATEAKELSTAQGRGEMKGYPASRAARDFPR